MEGSRESPGLPVQANLGPPDQEVSAPLVLVFDVSNEASLPAWYRTTADPLRSPSAPDTEGATPPFDLTGWDTLQASASAQFTASTLAFLLSRAGTPGSSAAARLPVWVIDLRRESHAFLDGEPVSWWAFRDWSNLGLDAREVQSIEQSQIATLAGRLNESQGMVELVDAKRLDLGAPQVPVRRVVSSVQSERQLVEKTGARYLRVAVTDHCAPDDREVERFVELVRDLPADAWLHFHCRGGRGRTTTFLALYDLLRNACKVSLPEILRRQERFSEYPLDSVEGNDAEDRWKEPLRRQRLAFLERFYSYARAHPRGLGMDWSRWCEATRGLETTAGSGIRRVALD